MTVSASERPTVLVVDDTPANLSLLSNLLKEHYRVKVANNGHKALELVAAALPDLVLLDIMMPDMDGYEVCRQLKANSRTRDIPVIFITAKTEVEDEMLGLALGAVDYLTKPVVPAIVMARVSTHLALRQLSRELEQKNQILNNEKEQLEDIVTRMRSSSPFDGRKLRHIQKSLERTCGDIVLSAYRPDGAQHVLVGDFSGHGLPAAFGGPLVSYIFYHLTGAGHDLQYILAELNRTLYRQLPSNLYMAASALELSPQRNQVRIWNYAVPTVLCLNDASGMTRVESGGLPLGLSESTDHFEPHARLNVQSATRIYQYSDGISEAKSPDEGRYGEEVRLEKLVTRIFCEQLPLEVVWDELDSYCGGAGLSDDAVMVETAIG